MIGNGLLASPKDAALGAALIVVLLFVFAALWLLTGLKKCPSDKILVVIGKLPKDANGCPQTSICVHGGAVFVVPLLQKHYYLDLNPLVCPVEIKKVVFSDDRTAEMSFVFTVAISVEPEKMKIAAERLLLLPRERIRELASEILCGQIRLAAEETKSECVKEDRDSFLLALCERASGEIGKIGLIFVNAHLEYLCEENEKSRD